MKNLFFVILSLIFFAHFIFIVYNYRDNYISKFDANYWKERYLNSQWIEPSGCNWDPHINPITCVWDDAWFAKHPVKNYVPRKTESIGDDGLYAYAGWEYIHGKDPTLLNAEIPPLGKYLIGLSIIIFNNQNIFALLSAVSFLYSFYLLNTQIFKSRFLAVMPVVLFSFESLFYTQLRAPFLDLLYGSFLFLVFYFVLKKKYIPSMIFLGCMMATKVPVVSFVIVSITVILFLFFVNKFKGIKSYLYYTPIAIGVFVFTYLRYFLLGHNIIDFLKVQKWIFTFYNTGAKGKFGDIFQMILTGKWSTWFSSTIPISEWQNSWPIVFICSFIYVVMMFRNKTFDNSLLIILWILTYLLFLTFIPVFPRYLLVLLPFFYILLVNIPKLWRLK